MVGALIAILTSDWGGGTAVRSTEGGQQEPRRPHFNSSNRDFWIIGRRDNVCMADITVWAIMSGHTFLHACTHKRPHTLINLCKWTGQRGREERKQYRAIIFESSWIPPTHHTHTLLILYDRNTDVSKPWGHLLNQVGERRGAAGVDR